MEQYKLNKNLDANKVFLVKRSKILGRFDPSVYANNFRFVSERFENKKLLDIAFINPTTNLASLSEEDDISFIQMDAIDEHLGNLKYIESKKVKEKIGFTRFKENDLIWAKITPCMQNGKSAIVKNTINGFALGSTEFFIIRPKNESIKIEYLHFLLRDKRVLETAMKYFGGSAGQQRVSKDFLLNFNVPIPPISVQEEIVSIINNAYAQKQAKEAEAKKLLASIDNYLLNELGITLPEKDNSLEARIFTTNFSEVAGGRLDPDYNSKIDYLLSQKANYNLVEFKTLLLKNPQYGANEEAVDIITADEYIRYIRITDIDEIGELKNEKLKSANNTDDRYLLNYNDLLFARSGSVGKCYIHKNTLQPAIFAGYLIRFLVDSAIANPNFIFYYCNSSIYKFWVSAIERPAVQSNINSEEFKKMPIPLPPIEKQNEIADYIAGIRAGAKRLQEEAVNILDNAKHQVEQIILG